MIIITKIIRSLRNLECWFSRNWRGKPAKPAEQGQETKCSTHLWHGNLTRGTAMRRELSHD